jgi:hypothetical protein
MRKLLGISVIVLAVTACHVQKKSKPCVQCPHYAHWPVEIVIDYHTFNIEPELAKK